MGGCRSTTCRSEGGEGAPDPVESLESGYWEQFGGAFPRAATGYPGGDALRDACRALRDTLEGQVLLPCLSLASVALGMEEEELATRWLEEGATADQLRLARYRPEGQGGLLYGEHTDYDGFTFLWRNRTNGLQARLGDSWVDLPLLPDSPDALLINLGDLMEAWTGGVWRSPRHRVAHTQGEGELVSIVWFAGPHPSTRILPLPSPHLTDSTREQMARHAITAGQHVTNKINKTFLSSS